MFSFVNILFSVNVSKFILHVSSEHTTHPK